MELHEISGQTISRHAHPRPDYARNTQPNNPTTKFGGNDILVIFNGCRFLIKRFWRFKTRAVSSCWMTNQVEGFYISEKRIEKNPVVCVNKVWCKPSLQALLLYQLQENLRDGRLFYGSIFRLPCSPSIGWGLSDPWRQRSMRQVQQQAEHSDTCVW